MFGMFRNQQSPRRRYTDQELADFYANLRPNGPIALTPSVSSASTSRPSLASTLLSVSSETLANMEHLESVSSAWSQDTQIAQIPDENANEMRRPRRTNRTVIPDFFDHRLRQRVGIIPRDDDMEETISIY